MSTNLLFTNACFEVAYSGPEHYPTQTKKITRHIEVTDGHVTALYETIPLHQHDYTQIDVGHQLVLPTLKERHCHLDKSKLTTPWQPITPADSLVTRFTNEITELNHLEVSLVERAKALIELEMQHGVTFFRSHIDVHPAVGLSYLDQTLLALSEYKDQLAYELVAFPQHGMLRSQAFSLIDQALSHGATVIGGVDPYSLDQDVERSLAQTFELAVKHHVPIDIHVHDRGVAGKATVRELIRLTKEASWQEKVAISHAFGLNDFGPEEREHIFSELAKEKIEVISSVPIDGVIPPLMELQDAGVDVFLGCDNIYDSWSPFGDGDITEKLVRYCELFRQTNQIELTNALSRITDGYQMTGSPFLQVGMEASFITTKASCAAEFVARKVPITTSVYRGNLVYSN